jgi:hypothetical protein
MGYYYSTYVAFGSLVEEDTCKAMDLHERLEYLGDLNPILNRYDGVGFLLAGNYDNDKLFLTTECISVALGRTIRLDFSTFPEEDLEEWSRTLKQASEALGIPLLHEPCWFVIPDLG